jgi:DNA-binding transcriptional MerR regulator
MRIKALSEATGVEIETIRFYENQGLLPAPAPAPARHTNGYRGYAPAHLKHLGFVRQFRALRHPARAGCGRKARSLRLPQHCAGYSARLM